MIVYEHFTILDMNLNPFKRRIQHSADISVVPNGSLRWHPLENPESFQFWKDIERQYFTSKWYVNKTLQQEIPELKDTRFVEIYMTTKGNLGYDWADVGIEGFEDLHGYYPITKYFPDWLFTNHKEGEVVTTKICVRKTETDENDPDHKTVITEKEVVVSLNLSQIRYRYDKLGVFEHALTIV